MNSQVDPHPATSADRDTIEAWISGMERGIWNPTPAMKQRVALVLREFLARVAVVRPTRQEIARTIHDAMFPETPVSQWHLDAALRAADAVLALRGVAVSDYSGADRARISKAWLPAADAVLALFGVAVVRPTRDQIALRETVERAMTVADGCVAVTEERPSETWRAAFTASVFSAEAESEKEREHDVAVSDSQETPT